MFAACSQITSTFLPLGDAEFQRAGKRLMVKDVRRKCLGTLSSQESDCGSLFRSSAALSWGALWLKLCSAAAGGMFNRF